MMLSEIAPARTELVAEHGVVTGGHPLEAEAGVRVLEDGGNAVDAVVAAAFTGFVVQPASCGLGGYGHLALFLAERGDFIAVDHYVRAPLAARADMFEPDTQSAETYYAWPRVVGRRNESGHLAPAVPGAVAGLCAAHERFGVLPLARVLEPAIQAADAGVPVTWDLVLVIAERLEAIRRLPHTAAFLLRNGNPPKAAGVQDGGDRLDGSDLAATLRRIARDGPAGFYTGPVAEAIERECRAHGGILSAADLASYRPKILREPAGRYRSDVYITGNNPLGHEVLNILAQFDLRRFGPDSLEFRHAMAEALGMAFADQMMHYGDPDATRSPAAALADPAFAAARAALVRFDRALPRPIAAADPWPYASPAEGAAPRPASPSAGGFDGTSQMAAVDRAGNLVTLITSLTSGFGSLVLVPGTGVLLNNGMQNFDPRPGRANGIAPGKMPFFAASTLAAAKDGRAVFGACGSGGYRIETAVLHAFLYAREFGFPLRAAVDAPRVHCQGRDTYVDARIGDAVRRGLMTLGHTVVVQEEAPGTPYFGRVNAVAIDPATGLRHATTAPGWQTAAAGC